MSIIDQYIQISEEAAYGTSVPVTRGYEADADGWRTLADTLSHQGLRAGRHALPSQRSKIIQRGGIGRINSPVLHNGEGLRLKHLLGTSAGPASNVQTFKTNDIGPNGSYSVQAGRSQVEHATQAISPFTFLGCYPTDFGINVDVGSPLMLDIGYDARTVDTTVAAAAPAYQASSVPMFTWEDVKLEIAGAPYTNATAFTFNAQLGMNTERFQLRDSHLKAQPKRGSTPVFTGSISAEFDDAGEYLRFIAGAPFEIELTATGPTAISGAIFPTFQITLKACQYTGADPTANADSPTTQELPFNVLWDGSNAAVTIKYTSSDSAF